MIMTNNVDSSHTRAAHAGPTAAAVPLSHACFAACFMCTGACHKADAQENTLLKTWLTETHLNTLGRFVAELRRSKTWFP